MDALQRSWLLKLVWLLVPFVPITAVAASNHSAAGNSFNIISMLPTLLVLSGAAVPFAIALAEMPTRRARRRALSPLQRMQMSDEADAINLADALRVAEKPPANSLPRLLQAAIFRFGTPTPRALSGLIEGLGLVVLILASAMAFMDDPLGDLSRWIGRSLPLTYWPTYAILLATAVGVAVWRWLREMHDHYSAVANASGRCPFLAPQ